MESPAPRYLWVISFPPTNIDNANVESPYSKGELYIPVPSLKGEQWYNASHELEKDAIGFLTFIQRLCDEIRDECLKKEISNENTKFSDEEKKAIQKVNQNLKNLENLLLRFNEIMKKLNKPPPPEG